MDDQLRTLIDLQALDTRIAALEADAARLPREIAAIHSSVEEAQAAVDSAKTRLDAAKKEQRAKTEARLYEVKTNKEYSAVLTKIEDIKQEKGKVEEEILVLMESQERLAVEIKEADAWFKARESQGRGEEATLKEKLRGIEADLGAVRTERKELAAQLPAAVLADYDKLLRARGGLALVPVAKPASCGGCRVTITPQRLQELRAQTTLIPCESCGRYLYWPA